MEGREEGRDGWDRGEGGRDGGREGGREGGRDVMAIMKWVHMAWNGCIILNREAERSRVTS